MTDREDGRTSSSSSSSSSSSVAALLVGSADLLDMLTRDEPDVDFALALGADAYADLSAGRWRRSEDILRMVGSRVVVFRRKSSSSAAAAGGGGGEGDDDDDDDDDDDEAEGPSREGVARWSRRVDDGVGDANGNSADEAVRSPSSIMIVRIPTLSGVSSSAARATADVEALRGMLSAEVLEYVMRNRMYAFAEEEEKEEGGGEGEGVVKVNRIAR
jgi:nicotinic acid mononucleotide adenylyltransferase